MQTHCQQDATSANGITTGDQYNEGNKFISRRPIKNVTFQRLTCIRQTGTKREMDGTIRYTFAAEVSPNVPAVRLTLTVPPALVLFAEATFNEQARAELGDHHREEAQIIQNALLDAG